jgi:hypothetical protein
MELPLVNIFKKQDANPVNVKTKQYYLIAGLENSPV